MTLQRLAFPLLFALAATACAQDDGADADATAPVDATAEGVSLPPPVADAETGANDPASPLEPTMAVEPPPTPMPGSTDAVEQCDADAARGVIGQQATEEVVEQARQAAGAQLVRTLAPGQMVTMEYHFSRLNLHVDEANVIVDVRCG